MAIHSLRLSPSRKTRFCSVCRGRIERGDAYAARNASVLDDKGMRVYGFFNSHPECEWAAEALGVGVFSEGELSFPGCVPNQVMGKDLRVFRDLEGWDVLTEKQRERLVNWLGRRKKKGAMEFEFRYYNGRTKERTSFKATLDDLKVAV